MESSSVGDGYQEAGAEYVLPRNGVWKAVIIGLVEAAIALVVPIILFIVSLFGGGSHLSNSTSLQVETQTALLGCSSICFVPFITFAAGGVATGIVAVKRRLGFIAGLIGGGIFSLGILMPGTPGLIKFTAITGASDIGGGFGGVVAILVQVFVLAMVGGSISWLGACVATGKHPYYQSRVGSVK